MTSFLRDKLSVLVQRRLQVERRNGKRIAPNHQTLALLRTGEERDAATSLVHNLSVNGVAVHAERPYPIGTILHVLFVNASHTFSVAVDVKVVRCVREIGNGYLIAGPFSRSLSHEEIVPFIL
jgi:hypothetical protein